MNEELKWPWNREFKSTVKISSAGSLVMVKFQRMSMVKPTDGELRVFRKLKEFLDKYKSDKRIYEVKSSKSVVCIYCNSLNDAKQILEVVQDIDKKYFPF